MFHLRGSSWGPPPLPDFLRDQLDSHGFAPGDAGRCARLIGEQAPGIAAASSLFVDLGSCKFLEADIDGAIAAWRHAITGGHNAAAARSLLNLGLLHEHLQLHDRALELLARVGERDEEPYVTSAAMASARCQVARGDSDRAMETMARLAQRVMASRSEGTELCATLYGLGDIAEQAGRFDRAERAWRAAMAGDDPEIRQAAMERLSRLMLSRGQDHAAVELLSAGTFDSDDAGPVLLDAGERFLQHDEPTLASDVLAIVHGASCEAADRFRLADAKMRCGQVNEAIDELEALLRHPDEQVQTRALFSLGQVYAAHDMQAPAESMFARVVDAGDDYWSPVGALALGDLVAADGDAEAAREQWMHAANANVPRIADRARSRLDDQSKLVPAQDAPQPVSTVPPVAAAAGPSPTPSVTTDSVVISLDSVDEDEPIELGEPAVTAPATAPERTVAEPQLISLDLLEETDAAAGNRSSDEPIGHPAAAGLGDSPDQDSLAASASATVAAATVASSGESVVSSGFFEQAASSPTTSQIDDANPYAALAPDHDSNDVPPTNRNPYAELAPNFDAVEFEPPSDVEPGDWESILEGWPPTEPSPKPKKSSSAFSRYT